MTSSPKHHRIGLIVPSMNNVAEPDFYRRLPHHVTVHAHRITAVPTSSTEDLTTVEALAAMNAEVPVAAAHLAAARVDVIVYACTSGSFSWGPGGDLDIERRITNVAGIPAIATSTACINALRRIGASTVSVVSPYPEQTNRRLAAFLEAHGFRVAGMTSHPVTAAGSQEIADQEPSDIYAFAVREAHHADAVFMPCTTWRVMDTLGRIERSVGIPVVCSNQATLWQALQVLRVEPTGPAAGRLLKLGSIPTGQALGST